MSLQAIGYAQSSAAPAALAEQRQAVECYTRCNGLTVVAFHGDIASGQIEADRAHLNAALADLEANGTGILIVEHMSRLGRNRGTLSKLLATLAARNVMVHEACSGPVNMDRAITKSLIAEALYLHKSTVIRRSIQGRAVARKPT